MNKKPAGKDTLREKAEKAAAEMKREQPEQLSPEEMRAALHELYVHQIELEMQNEELRRAQAEIESARERYFDLYDLAPVGYCTLSEKGIILEANLTAARLLGAARGELIGSPITKFIYKEDQDAYYLHKLKLFEKEEPISFELRIKESGDAFFWADINASVLRDMDGKRVCRMTISDISPGKLAEEELEKTLRKLDEQFGRLQVIMEILPVGVWVADRNGKIIMQNNAAGTICDAVVPVPQTVSEYTVYKCCWQGTKEWIPAEDYPLPSALRGGLVKDFVMDFNRQNGTDGTLISSSAPIRNGNGDITGAVAAAMDITPLLKAEKLLVESEQNAKALVKELEEADKNKNEFLSALSHELRNPLAAISAGLQLLNIAQDEKQADMAKKIMGRQMHQLTMLVEDLLDMTRISHNKIILKKERVDLNALALSKAEDLQELFNEKGIWLSISISGKTVLIEADPVRIKQIIGNLLFNAMKYTDRGGNVALKVSRDDGFAILRVKDTGIGIEPAFLPKLYTPFFQTDQPLDRQGGGLGLGLSIAKEIAELHGGTIEAASGGAGKGTAFTVRLPLALSCEKNETEKKERQLNIPAALKILLVEDNRDLSELLAALLRTIGGDVYTACDGLDGLGAALKIRPDVIFCDIGLPGLNGYDLAEKIRGIEQLKNTYMVAITGYASAGDVGRALEAGFDRHISKPVDLFALMEVLDNL